MKIGEEKIYHVAELARLQISPEEVRVAAEELSKILSYIDQLNELDTSSIAPTYSVVEPKNRFRTDVARPPGENTTLDMNAPHKKNHFVQVPQIIERDGVL